MPFDIHSALEPEAFGAHRKMPKTQAKISTGFAILALKLG